MPQGNDNAFVVEGLNVDGCFEIPGALSATVKEVRAITSEELDDLVGLFSELFPGKVKSDSLRRHTDGTYTHKAGLLESLFFIYESFKAGMAVRPITDETNTMLSSVVYRIEEGIANCTPGFHDRVNSAVLSLKSREISIINLLYQYRVFLVEAAFMDKSKDVHAHNSFFRVANALGLGVLPSCANDVYRGWVRDDVIEKTLFATFNENYTLLGILDYINDNIKTQLLERYGYFGRNDEGYEESIFEGCLSFIKSFLNEKEEDYELLYVDEDTGNVLDIDWAHFSSKVFDLLLEKRVVKKQAGNLEQVILALADRFANDFQRIQKLGPMCSFERESKKKIQLALDIIFHYFDKDKLLNILSEHQISAENLVLLSVFFGHHSLALTLIEKGVGLNKKNGRGDTALTLAIRHNYTDIAVALIDKGAALDEKDICGNTALILAAGGGYKDIAIALIDKGAALDEKNKHGNTALISAVIKGHKEIALALIEKGAALDKRGKNDSTALIYAVRNGDIKIAFALINKGAALDEKNRYGNTALILAAQAGHKEIALALIKKGASLVEVNSYRDIVFSFVSPSIKNELCQAIDNRIEQEKAKRFRQSSPTFFIPSEPQNQVQEYGAILPMRP